MSYLYTNDSTDKYILGWGVDTKETEIVVSGEVSIIPSECFENNDAVEHIEIQEGVRIVCDRAFKRCKKLKSITISNSVWSLGLQVFQDCINLQDVKMSSCVNELPYKTFQNCKSLKKIILPGLLSLRSNVFEGCVSLEAVVAPQINLDKTAAGYKSLIMTGFIEEPELFDAEKTVKFRQYILSQKSKLSQYWLKKDYIPGIRFLAENGAVTIKNFGSLYLFPAQAADAKGCILYLLDWKNKNISPEDEFKLLSQKLNRKPTEISAFKKLWKYDVFKDNTIALTRFLGNDTDIAIPEKVGKYTVFRLNNTVFNDCNGENIKNVFIPKSVTEIRKLAFKSAPNATIHAQKGCYAEQYAMENDIPFAAEDVQG